MRQHISIDQLNTLSPTAHEKLRAWWKPQVGDWCYAKIEHYGRETSRAFLIRVINCINENVFEDGVDNTEYCDSAHKSHCTPLLSIGQMIEFLLSYGSFGMSLCETQDPEKYVWELDSIDEWISENQNVELCDALWEAVKEVLEKK